MVLSGHVGSDGIAYLAEPGSGGQQVHQMLFNTQFETNGGNGWLRVFEFSDDGTTVRVRTYSPFHNLEKTDPANSFTFEITPIVPLLRGDFNDDGIVDLADYSVWRNNLGDTTDEAINNLGDREPGIDAGDYQVWRNNFGRSTVPVSPSLVP